MFGDVYGWSEEFSFRAAPEPGPNVTTRVIAFGGEWYTNMLNVQTDLPPSPGLDMHLLSTSHVCNLHIEYMYFLHVSSND